MRDFVNIQLKPVYWMAEVGLGPMESDTVEVTDIVEEVEFNSEVEVGVADELSVVEVWVVSLPVDVEEALGWSVVGVVDPSRLCMCRAGSAVEYAMQRQTTNMIKIFDFIA
jgi:hypothetical protein